MCTAAPGERIELELPLPHGAEVVTATVQWASTAEPKGLGLAFADLPSLVADQILEAALSGFWLSDVGTTGKSSDTHLIVGDLKRLLEEI